MTKVARTTQHHPEQDLIVTDQLVAPHKLHGGQQLTSPNGMYRALMQYDGNFVVYVGFGSLTQTIASFRTGTPEVAGGGAFIQLGADGNLVVYTAGGTPVWYTSTSSTGTCRLVMQDDGNLVLYTETDQVLWNSGICLTFEPEAIDIIYDGTPEIGKPVVFFDSVFEERNENETPSKMNFSYSYTTTDTQTFSRTDTDTYGGKVTISGEIPFVGAGGEVEFSYSKEISTTWGKMNSQSTTLTGVIDEDVQPLSVGTCVVILTNQKITYPWTGTGKLKVTNNVNAENIGNFFQGIISGKFVGKNGHKSAMVTSSKPIDGETLLEKNPVLISEARL